MSYGASREIDFQTATSAGLRGLSDLEVLALAAEEGRILVSHDHQTMPQTFGKFIENVLLVWNASEAEDWANRIATIPF